MHGYPEKIRPAAAGISGGKLPSLDGVRAISFLIVFVAHAGLDHLVPGAFGLYLFFILSGYLITTLLIREREEYGSISLKLFYARRTLRIFPPLYVVILLSLVYIWLTHQTQGVTIVGVVSQALYFQNYCFFHEGHSWGNIPGLGPLWSLAVEEHFYLFFPPLLVFLRDRRKLNYEHIVIVLLFICGADLLWRFVIAFWFPYLFNRGIAQSWAEHATDARADSLLYGCLLACLEKTRLCARIFEQRRLERLMVPLSLAVLLSTFVIRDNFFRATIRYTLQGLALAPLLFYVVRYPKTPPGRILNSRILSRIGNLSYALYLVHYMVILEVSTHIMHGLTFWGGALSLLIALAMAELIHMFVEKPTEKIRLRLKKTSPAGTRNAVSVVDAGREAAVANESAS